MLISLIIFSIGILAFDLVAARWGRDSTDGSNWVSHEGDNDHNMVAVNR